MTYNVFGGTLSLTQSINQLRVLLLILCWQLSLSLLTLSVLFY